MALDGKRCPNPGVPKWNLKHILGLSQIYDALGFLTRVREKDVLRGRWSHVLNSRMILPLEVLFFEVAQDKTQQANQNNSSTSRSKQFIITNKSRQII